MYPPFTQDEHDAAANVGALALMFGAVLIVAFVVLLLAM